MAPELDALRDLWKAAPEPDEQTRADARATLFDEIQGATELDALGDLWQSAPEADEEARIAARARLFAEIGAASGRALPTLTPSHRRLHRGRLGLVLAVMVILVLLLASVAVAFGLHLIVFEEAEKAPSGSPIFENFAEFPVGAPPGMDPGVLPSETRRVATFGDVALWVAPTREGGFCWVFVENVGSCDRLGTMPLGVTWSGSATGPPPARSFAAGVVTQLSGYVNARWADALEIRFEDGDVIKPE